MWLCYSSYIYQDHKYRVEPPYHFQALGKENVKKKKLFVHSEPEFCCIYRHWTF